MRIEKLVAEMSKRDISAVVIPTSDVNLSEYVSAHWKVREYFSGFTGSSGTLVVVTSAQGVKKALWTDSRYFLQAAEQLKGNGIELMKEGVEGTPSVSKWLRGVLGDGSRVLVPAHLLSSQKTRMMAAQLKGLQIVMDGYEGMIDEVWKERPALVKGDVVDYEMAYAGESSESKVTRVRKRLRELGLTGMVSTACDEIAWLTNKRGNEVECNPVFMSYLILTQDRCEVFRDYDQFLASLGHLEGRVSIDEKNTSYAVERAIKGCALCYCPSVIAMMKACKNDVEIAQTRRAMEIDGVAMVRFWRWLENAHATGAHLTEISIGERLDAFRAMDARFKGVSFLTIVGWREHGAIVHYSATTETNAEVKGDGLLLIDSGGQYLEGTTDITRTFVLGTIDDEAKRDYTLVLKGHIALARAQWKKGTSGTHLDALAKQYLWADGKDFGHGTGHGVGHYLCVHEGPQRISPAMANVALAEGMVTSNEPGYYREGKYGIRHENVTLVVKTNKEGYLKFETLTLCPFDKRGLDESLLRADEKEWIADYNAQVINRLSPYLEEDEISWLKNRFE